MLKIGIVTITDYLNIGNRLQNLAVQIVFENRYHAKVETIQNFGNNLNFRNNCSKEYFKKTKKQYLKNVLKGYIYEEFRKYLKFYKFNKNINISKYYFCKDSNYDKIDKSFNYFVVGSDQVWNPMFFYNFLYNNFLMFTSKNKKITFSPSISVPEIPKEKENEMIEYLDSFDQIFIREESSVDLIKKYTNVCSDWMFDPTLFLTKDEWLEYSSKKLKINQNYVLTYFLGDIAEELKYEIYLFAREKKLQIININNQNGSHEECFSPDEFIFLINNASYVFTDSFHGSVFSFIFEKRVIIYNRKGTVNLNSRIESLVNNLNLQRLKRSSIENLSDIDEINIDYVRAREIINQKKEQFFIYLDNKIKGTTI